MSIASLQFDQLISFALNAP